MANLIDTIINGVARVTGTLFADKVQTSKVNAPTTAGGSTYGPGSNGQVLKSNGTTVYWADDNNTQAVSSVAGKTGAVTLTSSDVGLGNVGNFKAVSTVASQGLSDTEKSNARANIGAGTSSFSGSYNDLTNKPTIPSAVTESTVSGWGFTKNAGTVTQVKVGSTAYNPSSGIVTLPAYPTSLPANDVYSWAKASSKPSYTASEVGAAASSHTHGNIQNGGTLQTNDVTIANGDKLVITDSNDSSKIARASISFDGTTTTKALTQKGTWETFNNYSHPTGDGNLHVPATSTTHNGQYLKAGSTAGSLSWGTPPDTKNTAGATNTDLNNNLYLVLAKAQQVNPQTYTNSSVYIDTNGHIHDGDDTYPILRSGDALEVPQVGNFGSHLLSGYEGGNETCLGPSYSKNNSYEILGLGSGEIIGQIELTSNSHKATITSSSGLSGDVYMEICDNNVINAGCVPNCMRTNSGLQTIYPGTFSLGLNSSGIAIYYDTDITSGIWEFYFKASTSFTLPTSTTGDASRTISWVLVNTSSGPSSITQVLANSFYYGKVFPNAARTYCGILFKLN